jgi:hypothetical protein
MQFQANENVDRLAKSFIRSVRARGLSPATARTYQAACDQLVKYLQQQGAQSWGV